MQETVQSFAQRVKAKDSKYQGMDDAKVVYDVLNKAPVYGRRFRPQEKRNNIFGTIFREALLGFAETGSKTVEGIQFNLASMIASETMTEEQFINSDKAGTMSYEDYKERNDERVEVENKAIAHAQNVGDFFENLAPEQISQPQGTAEVLISQVARGLGQMGAYAATTIGMGAAGTALGSPVGGAIAAGTSLYTMATMNRQMEFIDDAERTMGKNITEMSADEKNKVTAGSLGYGAITGVLDATVFKYVAGMPNAFKAVIQKARMGKSVSEPLFKHALGQASMNALKRGGAEGLQESIGDGMTLDIMAKNLYDDDRKFITGDALGRRVMEFTVGGLVGGIASGIGDSGRILQGKEITAEGQQRLEDERDRILEVMPSVDREKIARAILDGDPEPEITVFDINGNLETVKVKNFGQDQKIEVERSDGSLEILGEGDLVEYNVRNPEYALQVETETAVDTSKKLDELSDSEIDQAIKEREQYAKDNAKSEDPLFISGVRNAMADVFALRAAKKRKARLQREGEAKDTPKKPKKKGKEIEQTKGETYTATYTSKETGQQTTTEVVASSQEEAEAKFRELYADDISRDGDPVVELKGKPEPAPTEPEPEPTTPEPTEPDPVDPPAPEPTTPEAEPEAEPEVDTSTPIKEQIKKKFKTLKGFAIQENDSEIKINKSSSTASKFDREDVLNFIEEYADATGKRIIISGGAVFYLKGLFDKTTYTNFGKGARRLPRLSERPDIDVGQELDPIPEESDIERDIEEAGVIKFIKDKFDRVFKSPLLALGGTKLRVKFITKAPNGNSSVAYYAYAQTPDAYAKLFSMDEVLSDDDHTIVFYVDMLLKEGDGTAGIIKTVRHELMHALARVAANKKGKNISKLYEDISKSLTPSQRELMDELYGGQGYQYNHGQHHGRGAEFFRAVLEEFSYGTPSEESTRRKAILKNGTAFQKVALLVQDVQRYISNFFKADILKNPDVATLFIDSVNLLAQMDPEARPVDQKLIDLVRSRISPNTGTLSDNVNDYTQDSQEFIDQQNALESQEKPKSEPLPKEDSPKGMSFASKYLIPVGQLLANIHPDLEKAFHKYLQNKDEKILTRHRMAKPFANKFNELKKSNEADYIKLWALISFSPKATDSRYGADEQTGFIEERNALLKQYGMYNEYLAVRKVLDNVMNDALDTGIDIGFLEQYFPRYLNADGRDGFLKKYAGIDRSTFLGEIDAENKRRANLKSKRFVLKLNGEDIGTFGRLSAASTGRARRAAELGVTEQEIEIVPIMLPTPQPPIEEGSIQEVQFIQKLFNDPKYKGKGRSNFQESRVIEKLSEEDVQFYLDPVKAFNKYIIQMTTTIETANFAGLNKPEANSPSKDRITVDYDPTSELGRLVAKLMRENPDLESQQKFREYLPQIYKAIMSKGAQEAQLFAWMRQFSYFSLLVEVTSTMSQLYDLPFIMYDNGFLPTLRSMIGNREFNVGDYLDQNRMIEENFGGDKDAALMKITSRGLKLTGFRKLDQIMKNTTMDANYRRYMNISKGLNLSYINPDGSIKKEFEGRFNNKQRKFLAEINRFLSPQVTNPNEPMELLVALRTEPRNRNQRQQDLIKSTLVAKLFQNQPLSELRMPLAVRQDPNMRMWYTMKSFMIVQINTARNLAFNKIARGLNKAVKTGGKEGVDELKEGMLALVALMGYFVLLGIPVDFVKDIISGRVGYISDYTFNSMVRVAGINKYLLYKGRNEGYGTAVMNFALPAPLAAVIDTGDKMTAMFEKEGSAPEKIFESGILKQLPLYDTLHYVVPELRDFKRERERYFMKRRMQKKEEGFLGLFEEIEPRPTRITREFLDI